MGSNISKENIQNLPSKFCPAYRHSDFNSNKALKAEDENESIQKITEEKYSKNYKLSLPVVYSNEKNYQSKENEKVKNKVNLSNHNHTKSNMKKSNFLNNPYLTRNCPFQEEKCFKDNRELNLTNKYQDSHDNIYNTFFYYEPITVYEKIPVNKENQEQDLQASLDFKNNRPNLYIENKIQEKRGTIISKQGQMTINEHYSPINVKIQNNQKNYAKSSEKPSKNLIQVNPRSYTKLCQLKLHYDYKNIEQNLNDKGNKYIENNPQKIDFGYNQQLVKKQNYINQDHSLLSSDTHSISVDYEIKEKDKQNYNTGLHPGESCLNTEMKGDNHSNKTFIERKSSINKTKLQRPITRFRKSLIEYDNLRKVVNQNSPQHFEEETRIKKY